MSNYHSYWICTYICRGNITHKSILVKWALTIVYFPIESMTLVVVLKRPTTFIFLSFESHQSIVQFLHNWILILKSFIYIRVMILDFIHILHHGLNFIDPIQRCGSWRGNNKRLTCSHSWMRAIVGCCVGMLRNSGIGGLGDSFLPQELKCCFPL